MSVTDVSDQPSPVPVISPPQDPPVLHPSSPTFDESTIAADPDLGKESVPYNDHVTHQLQPDTLEKDPESFKKIYDGASISIMSLNCLIMNFSTKHNLTYNAIDDLLDLLKLICPKPNEIPPTIYKLKKFFEKLQNNLQSYQ